MSAESGKYLVLSYIYRPGWNAYINGSSTPLYRAYGFMCVRMPPGDSDVTFKYTPVDVYVGAMLTVLALVAPLGVRRVF